MNTKYPRLSLSDVLIALVAMFAVVGILALVAWLAFPYPTASHPVVEVSPWRIQLVSWGLSLLMVPVIFIVTVVWCIVASRRANREKEVESHYTHNEI